MTLSTDRIKDLLSKTIKEIVGFMNIDCRVEFREETEVPTLSKEGQSRGSSISQSNQNDSREIGKNDRGTTLIALIYIDDDARFLIGRNGQNLKALESLVRTIFIKNTDKETSGFKNIAIDINDYRKAKISILTDIAKQAVARVRNTQKAEALAPMSAYERRIVHMELASYPDIATESIGTEPQRRIVIKPYL